MATKLRLKQDYYYTIPYLQRKFLFFWIDVPEIEIISDNTLCIRIGKKFYLKSEEEVEEVVKDYKEYYNQRPERYKGYKILKFKDVYFTLSHHNFCRILNGNGDITQLNTQPFKTLEDIKKFIDIKIAEKHPRPIIREL